MKYLINRFHRITFDHVFSTQGSGDLRMTQDRFAKFHVKRAIEGCETPSIELQMLFHSRDNSSGAKQVNPAQDHLQSR